uniref:Uncharacterized protein n=1 Tax=Arundo donax TaxID=35708 RepID=A0A0A9ELN8_ARUDO
MISKESFLLLSMSNHCNFLVFGCHGVVSIGLVFLPLLHCAYGDDSLTLQTCSEVYSGPPFVLFQSNCSHIL